MDQKDPSNNLSKIQAKVGTGVADDVLIGEDRTRSGGFQSTETSKYSKLPIQRNTSHELDDNKGKPFIPKIGFIMSQDQGTLNESIRVSPNSSYGLRMTGQRRSEPGAKTLCQSRAEIADEDQLPEDAPVIPEIQPKVHVNRKVVIGLSKDNETHQGNLDAKRGPKDNEMQKSSFQYHQKSEILSNRTLMSQTNLPIENN